MARYPTPVEEMALVRDFESALHSCIFVDGEGVHHPLVCSVCDTMEKEGRYFDWMKVKELSKVGAEAGMTHQKVETVYPVTLVAHYKVPNCPLLGHLVLSPRSIIDESTESIALCNQCKDHFTTNSKKRHHHRFPPSDAIIMGYMIGTPPTELTCLNEVELAMVSTVRTSCQTWIYFGGCHQHIQGWHTFYDHQPQNIVGHLSNLNEAGLRGQLLVVLCGPFTTQQAAIARRRVLIDPDKIIRAFNWLKENNFNYKDMEIPSEIPQPYIHEENMQQTDLQAGQNVILENQVHITIVLPDGSNANELTAGFKSQTEFREYVMQKFPEGNFNATIHSRPSTTAVLPDYDGTGMARAFPLLFPYGHSGLPGDPAIESLKEVFGIKTVLDRKQNAVLRKYLQHGNRAFHCALFILIVFNVLMKEVIFRDVRLKANYKQRSGNSFAEEVGAMTVDELNRGVEAARKNHPSQFSNECNASYLRSVVATCGDLPHTNEAAQVARKQYFGHVMQFGLPAVFLTLTPDDKRNYRICLYALPKEKRYKYQPPEVAEAMSNEVIFEQYLERQNCRSSYPGLCAEEYNRIVTLVIEHLFQWDSSTHKAKGVGICGELQAWCLATEEQGRKTLHGHFLLFLKDWKPMMKQVQCNKTAHSTKKKAKQTLLKFAGAISSAKLFHEEDLGDGIFSTFSRYQHEGCPKMKRNSKVTETKDYYHRKRRRREPEVKGVDEKQMHGMRHKRKCREHTGHIATCECGKELRIDNLNAEAVNHVMQSSKFQFPDLNGRLDNYLFNEQMNVDWCTQIPKLRQRRYFMGNVFHNHHLTTHTKRCFAKGCQCYAKLPDIPCKDNAFDFKAMPDEWFDLFGESTEYMMFRFRPARTLRDAFMNTHSPILTKSLGYNTNVMVAMNGPCVFYVTGYQAKGQQKEEMQAYSKVAEVVAGMIKKYTLPDVDQVPATPQQEGFRRLLGGVYAQCNAHICAAPMAHYLALKKSRFRFSHSSVPIPVTNTDSWLLDEASSGTFRSVGGKPVWTHKAMNYLYRPADLHEWTFFEFFQKTEVMPIAVAEKKYARVHRFTAEHPLFSCYAIAEIPDFRIGYFPWHWLGSTSDFGGSLLDPALPDKSSTFFKKREIYCRRFLTLFKPFQEFEEILGGHATYQEAFRAFAPSIKPQMKDYANNIQDIHNSLRVEMPLDELSSIMELDFPGEGDFEEMEDEGTNANSLELQATLGQAMLGLGRGHISITEEDTVEPTFVGTSGNVCNGVQIDDDTLTTLSGDTCCVTGTPGENDQSARNLDNSGGLFTCPLAQLNTLVVSTNGAMGRSKNLPKHATGSTASVIKWGKTDELDSAQQRAFEILAATYILTFYNGATGPGHTRERLRLEELAQTARQNGNPLAMFVTGPGGAGKSRILESLMAYARAFSGHLHHQFTSTTIRLSAITGSAATAITGDTTCRQFGLLKRRFVDSDKLEFLDTRLNVVDEVSFATQTTLRQLSKRLQRLTESPHLPYGNIPILFLGDFCQLDGIGGEPIFQGAPSPLWHTCLTHMVELDGMHRYKDDPIFGLAMAQARDGNDKPLRKLLQTREIYDNNLSIPQNLSARYAVYTNRKRAEINSCVVRTYLRKFHCGDRSEPIPGGAIVIRSSGNWSIKNTLPVSNVHLKDLWEFCSDADAATRTYKVDPFLVLFGGCELMMSDNFDVKNGIANGTCGRFVRAVKKPNAIVTPMKVHGRWVNTIDVHDVDHIEMKYDEMHGPAFVGKFKIFPTTKPVKVHFPCPKEMDSSGRSHVNMDLAHLPIVLNYATTVHKLQGKSVDNLVIVEWCRTRNWAYVVLSRVRTLAGLFLTSALPDDISFTPSQEYLKMMDQFRSSILSTALSDERSAFLSSELLPADNV